jgi:hypothetical protein
MSLTCQVPHPSDMVFLLLSRPLTRGGEALWHHIVAQEGLSAHHTAEVIVEGMQIDIHLV